MSRHRLLFQASALSMTFALGVAMAVGGCGGGEEASSPSSREAGEAAPASPEAPAQPAAVEAAAEARAEVEIAAFEEAAPVSRSEPGSRVSADFDPDASGEETATVEVRLDDRGEEVLAVSLGEHDWTMELDDASSVVQPSLSVVPLLPGRPPLLWLEYGLVCGAPCIYSYAHLLLPVDGEGLRDVWSEEVGYDFGMEDWAEARLELREGWVETAYAGERVRFQWDTEAALFQFADVEVLEEAEAGPAARDPEELHDDLLEAVAVGDPQWVAELLDAGADPSHSVFMDNYAVAPVISALNDPTILRILLEAGGDPDVLMDISGRTPLIAAAERGLLVSAELLLDHGAPVNQLASEDDVDEEGTVVLVYRTPLAEAARRGHREMVTALLEAGADPSMGVGVEGEQTSAELAEEAGHADVAQLIREWEGR